MLVVYVLFWSLQVLLETMYELPSNKEVTKVVIDESVIKGESEPLLIYQNAENQLASSGIK